MAGASSHEERDIIVFDELPPGLGINHGVFEFVVNKIIHAPPENVWADFLIVEDRREPSLQDVVVVLEESFLIETGYIPFGREIITDPPIQRRLIPARFSQERKVIESRNVRVHLIAADIQTVDRGPDELFWLQKHLFFRQA